jgi:hypothetical protein
MIDGLAGIKNKGTVNLVCSKCRAPVEYATGAQNKDQPAYILICSKCHQTLGGWTSIEARDNELRDFREWLSENT